MNKGQFSKGHTETKEEKLYRIERMKAPWKNRADYINDIKDPKIYNIWRSFRFTKRGKKIGNSESWNIYREFYEDMFPTFENGKRLIRIDKTRPFSKENCIWATNEEAGILKGNNILIEYNSKKRTIKEWAYLLNKPISSIRNRYHKYKNIISIEEVLFGKNLLPRKNISSGKDLSDRLLRNKASKLCSTYRFNDSRKGYKNNLTNKWLIDNILLKSCIYCGTTEQIGADRIDNSKGHTMDNVIPCCYSCNAVRGDRFSYEEMLIIGQTINEIINQRDKNENIYLVKNV